jgi:hypothetical protein
MTVESTVTLLALDQGFLNLFYPMYFFDSVVKIRILSTQNKIHRIPNEMETVIKMFIVM